MTNYCYICHITVHSVTLLISYVICGMYVGVSSPAVKVRAAAGRSGVPVDGAVREKLFDSRSR